MPIESGGEGCGLLRQRGAFEPSTCYVFRSAQRSLRSKRCPSNGHRILFWELETISTCFSETTMALDADNTAWKARALKQIRGDDVGSHHLLPNTGEGKPQGILDWGSITVEDLASFGSGEFPGKPGSRARSLLGPSPYHLPSGGHQSVVCLGIVEDDRVRSGGLSDENSRACI